MIILLFPEYVIRFINHVKIDNTITFKIMLTNNIFQFYFSNSREIAFFEKFTHRTVCTQILQIIQYPNCRRKPSLPLPTSPPSENHILS